MDRDKVVTLGWSHNVDTQWTQLASLAIVMLGACLVSFLLSLFVPRRLAEDRSDGLLPPLIGQLSACVINRRPGSWEWVAPLCGERHLNRSLRCISAPTPYKLPIVDIVRRISISRLSIIIVQWLLSVSSLPPKMLIVLPRDCLAIWHESSWQSVSGFHSQQYVISNKFKHIVIIFAKPFQIASGWNSEGMLFTQVRIDWRSRISDLTS